MWNSPGFIEAHEQLHRPAVRRRRRTPSGASSSPRRSAASSTIPTTAEQLIPKDHRFGEKRPPFVTGYFEAFNDPKVSLVDLARDADRAGDRDRDRDDRRRARVRHHRVGDRLRLRHRRAATAWGSSAATGSRSPTTGPTARPRSSACRPRGFPNFFFPGGPHAAAGNNPRYNGDQVDFVTDTLVYAREHGYDVDRGRAPRPRSAGPRMVDKGAAATTFGDDRPVRRHRTSRASRGATCSTPAAGRSSSR